MAFQGARSDGLGLAVYSQSQDFQRSLSSINPFDTRHRGDSLLLENLTHKVRDLLPSRTSHFNDSSPTIVNEDCFGTSTTMKNVHPPVSWKLLVDQIFASAPLLKHMKFLEEFRYIIVTSAFLHDIDPDKLRLQSRDYTFKTSEELNAIRNADITFHRLNSLRDIVTKNYHIKTTLHHSELLLRCYRIAKLLNRKIDSGITGSKAQVLSLLLIGLYLTFEQRNSVAEILQKKVLQNLDLTVAAIQDLNSLLYRFYLRYKEEMADSMLHTTLAHKLSETTTLSTIKALTICAMDSLYYNIQIQIGNIIVYCNPEDLSKYCHMYSLDLSELLFYIEQDAIDIEAKSTRVRLFEKFFFCCLLSVNNIKTQRGTQELHLDTNIMEMLYIKYSITKADYFQCHDEINLMNNLITMLSNTNHCVNSAIYNLKEHKLLLESVYQNDIAKDVKEIEEKNVMASIMKLLNELEQKLYMLNKYDDDTRNKLIYDKVQALTKLSRSSKHVTSQTLSESSNVPSSEVATDITDLKKLHCSKYLNVRVERINLNQKVQFIDALEHEENVNDLDNLQFCSFSDNLANASSLLSSKSNPCRDTTILQHEDNFGKLSDRELENRLNEKIRNFSIENKRSKDQLRMKKSMELLKGQYTSVLQSRNAPQDVARNILTSEVNIPMIYEIDELLN
ncbi:hypothetical protein KAFR_0B04870 [Kazachstania africana CBS 2517]|uniref:Inheritance of peroxisomes protein 2 n=1 Tax=Kazachstania africana (strain ATCC 22294 / BCRC 22015 / CBS 2517 / CECT 1963 / NBRC 1671 / NRRL Y-8276) TaxID=1071382 RepID=H2AQY3_KAZAF|nr:hypothetical protein KAFR_0B04870 [Kazachstania africana CBS 2517]CCF56783.1 hypothetical protein KAFR_0B04870 [Kazachstania africana CBS 2517]